MQANVTIQDLERALAIVNSDYDKNLTFVSQPRHVGKTTRSKVSFRLRALDCKGRGGRRGYCRNKDGDRRRIGGCACWHAHGHFFEALYQVNSQAVITTAMSRITGPAFEDGNWQDRQAGSMFDPAYASELCDC